MGLNKTLSSVKKPRQTKNRKAGWYEVFKDGYRYEAFWMPLSKSWAFNGADFKENYFDEIGNYLG